MPPKEENPRLAVRRVIYEGAHDYIPKENCALMTI